MTQRITKTDIISDLINNVYCRIKPSGVHGVGVFAIRPIPQGVDPFPSLTKFQENVDQVDIPTTEVFDNPDIDPAVKSMVYDFFSVQDGNIEFPACSLNEIDITFFLNTSENPNLKVGGNREGFITLRQIEAGEELFVDYSTFSESVTPPKI